MASFSQQQYIPEDIDYYDDNDFAPASNVQYDIRGQSSDHTLYQDGGQLTLDVYEDENGYEDDADGMYNVPYGICNLSDAFLFQATLDDSGYAGSYYMQQPTAPILGTRRPISSFAPTPGSFIPRSPTKGAKPRNSNGVRLRPVSELRTIYSSCHSSHSRV